MSFSYRTKFGTVDAAAELTTLRSLNRSGSTLTVVLCTLFILTLVAGGVFFAFRGGNDESGSEPVVVPAEVELYEARVLDQGEIQSSDNYEFRCEVNARYGETKVIWVIEEGKRVEPGTLLIELDKSKLEEALIEQQLAVNNSEKLVKQADSAHKAAIEAYSEYFQGTFVELERTIQNEIFVAEQQLRTADQFLRHSERLAAKSYVTDLQLESDRFEVERARNNLDLAIKKLEILRNQTRNRMEIELQADIDAKSVELANEEESNQLETATLAEIKDQIEKCIIAVPEGVSGQVVYANKYNRRGAEWVLEEGAEVRERQVLIRLPNPNQMQVRATINESQIASVKPGQVADIKVDALNDSPPLKGEVIKVNQYAEPDGWGSGGVRKYAVLIEINNPPKSIRPGMNSSVNILVEKQDDAVQIPIQCLFEYKKNYYCLVKKGESYETRKVQVGSTNEKAAWIQEGIQENEQVVMAPRNHRDLMDHPDLVGDSE